MIRSAVFKHLFFGVILLSTVLYAENIARVIKSNGDVTIKPIGSQTFNVQVRPGQAIANGDAIHVGESAFAVVIFLDDRSVVKIRENTEFQFVETSNTRTLNIERGTLLNKINKAGRTKTFRVETPVSVASVKGTEFAAIIDPSGVDSFIGKTGQFDVFNLISGQTITVGPGQKAISNAMGQLIPAPAQPGDYPEDPEGESFEEPEPEEEEPEEPEESVEEEQLEQPQEEPQQEQQPQEPEPQVQEAAEVPETPTEAETPADEPAAKPKKPYNIGLGLGSATIDGQIYNQFALRPELSFGKLGIGLDLVLYIDNEGNIRKDEWDEATDFFDKFLYIRWGQKQDPFWFKWGSLNSVTLGYGGLLSGYSNMMEFPTVRPVGINTGVNIGPIGTEIFLANVKDFSRGGTLIGLRGTYRVSDAFPLTVGVNFVTDINQFSGLKDKDKDYYPDIFDDFPDDKDYFKDSDGDGTADEIDPDRDGNGYADWVAGIMNDLGIDSDSASGFVNDPFLSTIDERLKKDPFNTKDNAATATGFAFDIGYPVLRSTTFSVEIYTEYNKLIFPEVKGDEVYSRPKIEGTGITIPGIRASLFKFLNVSFEYRIKQGYYVSQFFDQSYDLNRVVAGYNGGIAQVKTKDQIFFSDPASAVDSKGMYGSASASLFNLASFSVSYANMKADTTEFNSFNARVTLNAENIPKLSVAELYYQRNNDKNPFDFGKPSVNTVLGYKLGYEVSKGVSLIWDFRQFYRDTGAGLEPVKQTTIETAFNF